MTFDIAAFRPQPDGSIRQSLLDGDTGQLVVGPRKLAQRFALKFLTPKGSILGRPGEGSKFIQKIRDGKIQTELDIFAAFASAMLEITPVLTREESQDDPDDERFRAAIITQVRIGHGDVELEISIKNRAGAIEQLKLPLQFRF